MQNFNKLRRIFFVINYGNFLSQFFGGFDEFFQIGDNVASVNNFVAVLTFVARHVSDNNQHVAEVSYTCCFAFDCIAAATLTFHSCIFLVLKSFSQIVGDG